MNDRDYPPAISLPVPPPLPLAPRRFAPAVAAALVAIALVLGGGALLMVAAGTYTAVNVATGGLSHEQRIVRAYILENANDAKSVEFVKWWKAIKKDGGAAVRVKMRGKNGLGAMIITDQVFVIENGKVLGGIDSDKIDVNKFEE
jgi:hypothetical protein